MKILCPLNANKKKQNLIAGYDNEGRVLPGV
jgi:hypothetical protein